MVSEVSVPDKQGYCSKVVFWGAEQGKFALKVSESGYRGDELHAEYLALMQEGRGLPIPQAFAYATDERGHYLLSSYCEGVPVSNLLSTADAGERLTFVVKMAEVLAQVHSISIRECGLDEVP